MPYPHDVAWPRLAGPHLVYHADDIGFNFSYPFGDFIEVSAGGYGEPLSHIIPFIPHRPDSLVVEFITVVSSWVWRARRNDLKGHGWFSDPDSDLPYVHKGENE